VDALILAAGLGTRLGELTRTLPKPLLPVGGIPMLERVARSLIAAGAHRLIINTHHLAGRIVEFVHSRDDFGVEVLFSHEVEAPLETGGAVLHAAHLLTGDEPFFIHNADILTNLPLERLYAEHVRIDPLATLAVMDRKTTRYLLFDDVGLLGRVDERNEIRIEVRPPNGEVQSLAFGGIHVVSPVLPQLLTETGAFSILDPYLRLSSEGYSILPFRAEEYDWRDIGKPEQLDEANRLLSS
jgi:N-acetyl-alpha-D-muramate 1-phosphate uridylyltransferase